MQLLAKISCTSEDTCSHEKSTKWNDLKATLRFYKTKVKKVARCFHSNKMTVNLGRTSLIGVFADPTLDLYVRSVFSDTNRFISSQRVKREDVKQEG
jgi:hypothetical protein